MTFKKGDIKPTGSGRKKGQSNHSTNEIRAHIKTILDATLPNALQWISEIDDPKKRIDAVTALLPYIIPKMSEVDLTGGEDIEEIQITIKKANGAGKL